MRAHGDLLAGADYRPHVPYSLHDGVYASEFGSPEATLWMVVNRNGEPEGDRRGEILRVPCVSGARYFDLYHGIELDVSCPGESTTVIRFAIEALVSRHVQSSWVASFSESAEIVAGRGSALYFAAWTARQRACLASHTWRKCAASHAQSSAPTTIRGATCLRRSCRTRRP